MARWLALLSGVNVSGSGRVPMAELRAAAAERGLTAPRTLLASGNLVFESDEADPARLEAEVEAILAQRFDVARKVIVRSAQAWRAAIDANPMPGEAQADPAHLLLFALQAEAAADAPERLAAVVVAPERVEPRGLWAYGWYPNGVGAAATDPKKVDRALGCRGTGRNWNTVLKLADMLEA